MPLVTQWNRGRTGTNSRKDIVTSFHFYVADAEAAIFTEVSGLEVEIEVTPYEEGGINDHVHKLPGRAKVSDITLKNGITTSTPDRNELWNWFREVLMGTYKRRHISIVLVDQKGNPVQAWKYFHALPIKWSGPQLNSGQSNAAIQTLVLTHRGLDLTYRL